MKSFKSLVPGLKYCIPCILDDFIDFKQELYIFILTNFIMHLNYKILSLKCK